MICWDLDISITRLESARREPPPVGLLTIYSDYECWRIFTDQRKWAKIQSKPEALEAEIISKLQAIVLNKASREFRLRPSFQVIERASFSLKLLSAFS